MNDAHSGPSSPTNAPEALMESVPYATPYTNADLAISPRYGTRVWAGLAILFGGLALIVLGGCFLIGVLTMTSSNAGFGSPPPNAPPPVIGPAGYFLMIVLYALAFGSFAGAFAVILTAVRGLYKILYASDLAPSNKHSRA